jgi:ribosome-associated translation inhibitor RaiA
MKVEIHTDTRVEGTADAIAELTEVVEHGLARFKDRLTRVEVHLSDLNGPKGGIDRRCMIEARPASHQPVAVHHDSETDIEALHVAVDKMKRLLTTTFEKLKEHRGGSSASGLPT